MIWTTYPLPLMKKLRAIPCNLITGFLGVGKTTCILNLLQQKPASERWAILVNEFGEIGLDGQLIESTSKDQQNIFIREVPGGCMCCSSGLPMQIALNLLLMKAKPDRLLIEPTGLGHPKEVLRILSSEHFKDVLSVENTITLINPKHFSSHKHLQNQIFQQQLEVADIILANKTDLASDEDIETFKQFLSEHNTLKTTPYQFTENGILPFTLLNRKQQASPSSKTSSGAKQILHHAHAYDAQRPALPDCGYIIEQHEEGGFSSIGWRINSERVFDLASTLNWFAELNALRIKALIRTDKGWAAFNISHEPDAPPSAKSRKTDRIPDYRLIAPPEIMESRMEMIFESGKLPQQVKIVWKENLRS